MNLPLNERYPGTVRLASAGIAELPTPLEPLDVDLGPAAQLGSLSVKRDDLTSPAYGGNKVRKLDLLLGDALESGARAVITFGAYGSNHALATAVHASALGLEPHVVLSPQEPGPYAPRTLLAHAGLGTVIHPVEGWDGRREAVRVKQGLEERDGVEPYVIPMGGTCPLGAVGYVNAAFEFESAPDVVYVAAGTLGTAVGLALGFAAAGTTTRVEAIRVTPSEICNEQIAEKLAADTVTLLRSLDSTFPELSLGDLRFSLRHEFFEPGYGVATEDTLAAVGAARQAGLALETTYTGKAFSALISDASDGALTGRDVVFWDTYSSVVYPTPGRREELPQALQEYIAECERLFGSLQL